MSAAEKSSSNDAGMKEESLDITQLVEKCAASLTVGDPIVSTSSFSLQDSMAAMELLDSKMDSCQIPANLMVHNTSKVEENATLFPRPAPIEIDDVFSPLPFKEITNRDAAFIAVEMLVRLESLLGGASVVESTFTCLYAHTPVLRDIKNRLDKESATLSEQFEDLHIGQASDSTPAQYAVYASARALVECTEAIRGIVLHADIYEEEDFCANTFGSTFYQDGGRQKTIGDIKQALGQFAALADQESDDVQAIVNILNFFLDFFALCSTVTNVPGDGVVETMQKAKGLSLSAVQHLEKLQTIYCRMKKQELQRTSLLISQAFDPFVNRPLFGNAPVRKVVFNDPVDSLSILARIVGEVDWALCDFMIKGSSLGRIRRILDRLSRSSVNILTRSLIVLNLYFDDKLLGQHSLIQWISNDMRNLASIPSDFFEKKQVRIFLTRLAKPIYDTLKLRVLDRNRQRNYMEAAILHDWSTLQREAHVVDVDYQREKGLETREPPYFSHYVLSTLVELMDLHVTIGVELRLFHSHYDLATVFWYRDFLLSTLLNNLATMRQTKQKQKGHLNDSSQKGKKKQNTRREKNEKNEADSESESKEYDFDYAVLSLKRNLCRGVVRFIAALHQAHVLNDPEFQFTSLERIFQKRFEVFSKIQQPPPLSYDDFLQGSDFSRVSQPELLFSTSECFKASKQLVSNISAEIPSLDPDVINMNAQDARNLAKVCIGNAVYVQKLQQLIQNKTAKTANVEFDFQEQREFCTIKLT